MDKITDAISRMEATSNIGNILEWTEFKRMIETLIKEREAYRLKANDMGYKYRHQLSIAHSHAKTIRRITNE